MTAPANETNQQQQQPKNERATVITAEVQKKDSSNEVKKQKDKHMDKDSVVSIVKKQQDSDDEGEDVWDLSTEQLEEEVRNRTNELKSKDKKKKRKQQSEAQTPSPRRKNPRRSATVLERLDTPTKTATTSTPSSSSSSLKATPKEEAAVVTTSNHSGCRTLSSIPVVRQSLEHHQAVDPVFLQHVVYPLLFPSTSSRPKQANAFQQQTLEYAGYSTSGDSSDALKLEVCGPV